MEVSAASVFAVVAVFFLIWACVMTYLYRHKVCIPNPQTIPSNIVATEEGVTLLPGLLLQNGPYVLLFQNNGNLALYKYGSGVVASTQNQNLTEGSLIYSKADNQTSITFKSQQSDKMHYEVSDADIQGPMILRLTHSGELQLGGGSRFHPVLDLKQFTSGS